MEIGMNPHDKQIVLSSAYLGNVHYYTKLLSGCAVIDPYENYQKQSYRNRCEILTANGVTALTVPVYYSSLKKCCTKDVLIDNTKKWQHVHWMSIVSAYRNSAFFEHYEHHFAALYDKPYDLLYQWNDDLQTLMLKLLKCDVDIAYSQKYIDPYTSNISIEDANPDIQSFLDLRNSLSPKPRLAKPDPFFRSRPYDQVFSDRFDFAENLSVLDLLFCEGPAAKQIIDSCVVLPDLE